MKLARVRSFPRRVSLWAGATHQSRPYLGPLIFVSSTQYFYAQIAAAWVFRPNYSLVNNTISDLGNTACTQSRGHDQTYLLCSPHHLLMNVAFGFLGGAMAVGPLFLYQEFKGRGGCEQKAALVGFALMSIAGVGAILVGVFPENTISYMHKIGAGLAIGLGNVGIFVLGAVLTLPEAMRRYMLVFSTISATALTLFACHKYFGIGAGTMERVAAYPETIWLITFGLYVWRFHPTHHSPSVYAHGEPTGS